MGSTPDSSPGPILKILDQSVKNHLADAPRHPDEGPVARRLAEARGGRVPGTPRSSSTTWR